MGAASSSRIDAACSWVGLLIPHFISRPKNSDATPSVAKEGTGAVLGVPAACQPGKATH